MKENKQKKPKLSKILAIIGCLLLAISGIFLILGFVSFNMGLFACGGFLLLIGVVVAAAGFRPYFTKLGAKIGKETLDYAGDDISAVGVRGVEVAEPVINKGMDVITPNVENIVRSVRKDSSGTTSKVRHCTECGAEMGQNESFCSKCGKKQANVCECGHTNDSTDKFCGNCGKPLK